MHTVAHIHEMKAEIKDGLEFMQHSEGHWKVGMESWRWPSAQRASRHLGFPHGLLGGIYRYGLAPWELRVSLEAFLMAKHPLGALQNPNTYQSVFYKRLYSQGLPEVFCCERNGCIGYGKEASWWGDGPLM